MQTSHGRVMRSIEMHVHLNKHGSALSRQQCIAMRFNHSCTRVGYAWQPLLLMSVRV